VEVVILENEDAVAELGAQRIFELVKKKPNAVLGLATGSTPIAMYKKIISFYESKVVSFGDIVTFNLDEYIGITADNSQSYRYFMNRELFDAIDIEQQNTHLPVCGAGENPREIGAAYEQSIVDAGGIDLQILGIGSNGHIGFNEPGCSLSSRTRVKTLTQSTVRDNNHLFGPNECQPHLAMTMGIATILDSRRTILLATGSQKAAAVRHAIEGSISSGCPATALQMHERVTFILDEAAASSLENKSYYRWAHHQNRSLVEQFGNFHEVVEPDSY
jgi:glucosamine-6-phosphate deaminase